MELKMCSGDDGWSTEYRVICWAGGEEPLFSLNGAGRHVELISNSNRGLYCLSMDSYYCIFQ